MTEKFITRDAPDGGVAVLFANPRFQARPVKTFATQESADEWIANYREIRTAEDVRSIRKDLDELAEDAESRYRGGPVDWDDYLGRIEDRCNVDLGEDMLSPAIKEIKKITRKIVRELRED